MRIGIDGSSIEISEKTGVQWYAHEIIQHLREMIPGEVEVTLYGRKGIKKIVTQLPQNWKAKKLDWPLPSMWTQGRLSLEIALHRPDVLFIPGYMLPPVVPKKNVVTIHDIAFKYFQKMYSKAEIVRQEQAIKRVIEKKATIIAPSEFTKNELISKYSTVDPTNIHVIHHGYNPEVHRPITDEARIGEILVKYGISKPFYIFLGRIEHKKNIQGLLKAHSALREKLGIQAQLVLVGKPGFGYPQLKKTISQIDDTIVKMIGWVPEEDIPYIINAAHALVLPSWYEGFGLPIIEAFACGTPVVASNTGALPEIAGDAGLLVSPNDPEEIAAALRDIMTDSNLHHKLREKGMQQSQLYSWNMAAKRTAEVLLQGYKRPSSQ